jgi:hypothetical protein
MPTLYFGSDNVKSPTQQAYPAKDLAEFFRRLSTNLPILPITFDAYHALPKAGQSEFKVRLPYFTPCTFPNSPWRGGRTNQNAGPCNLIILDVDDSGDALRLEQPEALSNAMAGMSWFAYRTASHTPAKPRMRVVISAHKIPPARYADAVRTVAKRLELKQVTPESLTPSQPMFVPCLFEGQDLDWDDPTIATSLDGQAFTEADIEESHTFESDATQDDNMEDKGGLEYLRSPLAGYTPAMVTEMLSKLDPDMPRAEWLKVAAALKHQFSADPEQGYELFETWSETAKSKYDGPESTRKLWDSLEANPTDRQPVTLATVLQMAQKAGWVDPRKTAQQQQQATQNESGLLGKLDNHRLHLTQPPPKPVSVYSLVGQQISTAGNITVISAQAKSGKTAVVGAQLASVLSAEDRAEGCGDFLGFTGAPHDGKAVIYFDTEQAPYDAWTLLHRASLRAEVKTWPENFRFYSLADVATPERRKMLSLEMKRAEQECRGIHSTFIDGVADLCLDPNDPAESFSLVEELQSLAIGHRCPLITVLHENPSGAETGKTRGHLGSQLERKAESNLRVFKDAKGICTIYSERCRRASIPKEQGPRFTYDVKAGMHLSYHGDVQEEKAETKRRKHESLVNIIFHNSPQGGLHFDKLKAKLMDSNSSMKDRTARRRIEDWKALQLVQVTPAGKYQKASATEDFC